MAQPYVVAGFGITMPSWPVQTDQLNQAYEALLGDLYDKLMAQTHFKPLFDALGLVFDETDGALALDVQATRALLASQHAVAPAGTEALMAAWGQHLMRQGAFGREVFEALSTTGVVDGTAFEQAIARLGFVHLGGSAGADALTGAGAASGLIKGGAGDDSLAGGSMADVLEGGAGADVLTGGLGNDILIGGAGADALRGGQGDDTYVFSRGDGADVITDFVVPVASYDHAKGGTDTLVLRDILASEVQVFREKDDLVLEFGQGDSVRVVGHFVQGMYGGYGGWLERVEFADGTSWSDWSSVALRPLNVQGTVAAESFTGTSAQDTILGGGGDDTIHGVGGMDVLHGEDGNDTIVGGGTLNGGAGDDQLTATLGGSVVDGGDGNDTIRASAIGTFRGGAGDDLITTDVDGAIWGNTYEGGAGNDTITGSYARDTYLFGLGDGHDSVVDKVGAYAPARTQYNGAHANYQDELRFGAGIVASDVQVSRAGNDLVFAHVNGQDSVSVKDWFADGNLNWIEKVSFVDGTVWNIQTLQQRVIAGDGTAAGEVLKGWVGSDVIRGGGGNDTITGEGGTDVLQGEDGNDHLSGVGVLEGGAGDDTIVGGGTLLGGEGSDQLRNTVDGSLVDGGAGDDTLRASAVGTYKGGAGDDVISTDVSGAIWGNTYEGGAGNDTITGSYARDTYHFGRGDGWDTIRDDVSAYAPAASFFAANPSHANYQDLVLFDAGIDADQLWFQRSGNDLQVSVIGSGEGMSIQGWYANAYSKVEEFRLSDGQALLFNQVDSLVNAMAAFAPPAPGQTSLTPEQQTALAPVIAAAWN